MSRDNEESRIEDSDGRVEVLPTIVEPNEEVSSVAAVPDTLFLFLLLWVPPPPPSQIMFVTIISEDFDPRLVPFDDGADGLELSEEEEDGEGVFPAFWGFLFLEDFLFGNHKIVSVKSELVSELSLAEFGLPVGVTLSRLSFKYEQQW